MHKYQLCCVIFAVFQGGCITSSGCSSIGLLGGYTQLKCAPTANGVVLMLRGDWKWTVDWKDTIHKMYKLGARDPRLFEVITANTGKYDRSKGTNFAPSSALEIRFELQANANAHVGLFTSGHDLSCMYEIIIGGWNNTQSAIRRSSQGSVLCSVPGPRLDGTLSTKMWMTLRDGRLRIGTSDIVGENEWMCGIDPDPREIVEVVPMTGWGASSMWKLRVGSWKLGVV